MEKYPESWDAVECPEKCPAVDICEVVQNASPGMAGADIRKAPCRQYMRPIDAARAAKKAKKKTEG